MLIPSVQDKNCNLLILRSIKHHKSNSYIDHLAFRPVQWLLPNIGIFMKKYLLFVMGLILLVPQVSLAALYCGVYSYSDVRQGPSKLIDGSYDY